MSFLSSIYVATKAWPSQRRLELSDADSESASRERASGSSAPEK
jgi:hypothetical protein